MTRGNPAALEKPSQKHLDFVACSCLALLKAADYQMARWPLKYQRNVIFNIPGRLKYSRRTLAEGKPGRFAPHAIQRKQQESTLPVFCTTHPGKPIACSLRFRRCSSREFIVSIVNSHAPAAYVEPRAGLSEFKTHHSRDESSKRSPGKSQGVAKQ